MPPPPVTLTFDLLTLKLVSESRVTWATSVPILVFLGLSVLDLGLMYVTDRQTDIRQHHHLMSRLEGRGIIICVNVSITNHQLIVVLQWVNLFRSVAVYLLYVCIPNSLYY